MQILRYNIRMDKYILDTNLFFNMGSGLNMGRDTETVVKNITQLIKKNKTIGSVIFFMPPCIVDEILSFFENKNQSFINDFLSQITIKSPDYHKININGTIFYDLIEDVRNRNYRGLTISEEEISSAGELMMGKQKTDKRGFQTTIGPVIKKFRERYRQATRLGFLDSVADLDLIMLAKEQDGFLVSSDEGVLKWGRRFGVKETPASIFASKLNN